MCACLSFWWAWCTYSSLESVLDADTLSHKTNITVGSRENGIKEDLGIVSIRHYCAGFAISTLNHQLGPQGTGDGE